MHGRDKKSHVARIQHTKNIKVGYNKASDLNTPCD